MRKLLGPSGYNRVMTKRPKPAKGVLRLLTISRLGVLATTVALTAGIVTATAGTAQASTSRDVCYSILQGKPTLVNCKTGKPVTLKQQNREANGGWDTHLATKADAGVFKVTLPKRLRNQNVKIEVVYTSTGLTSWLHAIEPKAGRGASIKVTRSATTKVRGNSITVAMPTSDYAGCYSLSVTVKGTTGKAYKYRVAGYGTSYVNFDNGYRDITVLP